MKQLARETGLPLATTYHLLRTLAHDGYIRKLDDGGFVLGEKLTTLHTGGRGQALLSRVRPALAALRDELSAAAYLTFYEDGEIRVAEIVDGPRAPRVDLWVGFEDAGHATALGKCVLRELDDDARDDYLARHPLADLTPRTITGRAELLRRLGTTPLAPHGDGHGGVRPGDVLRRGTGVQRRDTRLPGCVTPGGPDLPYRRDPEPADSDSRPCDQGAFAHYLKFRSLRPPLFARFLDETDI